MKRGYFHILGWDSGVPIIEENNDWTFVFPKHTITYSKDNVQKIIELTCERIKKLSDFWKEAWFFFQV